MALRRLRKFARTGRDEELDIDDTIKSTAHNGGMLDIKMRPERKNTVKVLLMLDIGGSMDAHVSISTDRKTYVLCIKRASSTGESGITTAVGTICVIQIEKQAGRQAHWLYGH